MGKLVVSLDGVVIKEVQITKDKTTLGRRPYNDIVIDNLAVSGEHAVIYSSGGEVYLEDLVGLPVLLKDGTRLGEIVAVANYGASDLIDVKVEGRRDTVLIPFGGGFIAEADAEKVIVDLPEGYLDEDAKE